MITQINNDTLIQYGQISLSTTTQAFSQPTLTANGTLGGSKFAVSASSQTSSGYAAWYAMDSSTSTYWCNDHSKSSWFIFYNPTALRITKVVATQVSGYTFASVSVQGSNNNSAYTNITSTLTNNSTTKDTITLTNTNYYKYYKFSFTSSSYPAVCNFAISAYYQTSALNSIIFPQSFSNTKYGCSFGYVGANTGGAYISSKTTTGISLAGVDSSSSSACYIGVGY